MQARSKNSKSPSENESFTDLIDWFSKASVEVELSICEAIAAVVDEFADKGDFLEVEDQGDHVLEFAGLGHSETGKTLFFWDSEGL